MKINKKIICAAAVLSLTANSVTAFGASCNTYKRFYLPKNIYTVMCSQMCGESKKFADNSFGENVWKEIEIPAENFEDTEETAVPEQEGNVSDKAIASSEAYEVLSLVNEYRAQQGLSALVMNESAVKAANVRAEEISRSFSHTRPDGRSCFTALDAVGITNGSRGENIASGYRTPADVMTAWMNSSGHRANILNRSYKELGVGIYKDSAGRLNWVQLFVG